MFQFSTFLAHDLYQVFPGAHCSSRLLLVAPRLSTYCQGNFFHVNANHSAADIYANTYFYKGNSVSISISTLVIIWYGYYLNYYLGFVQLSTVELAD